MGVSIYKIKKWYQMLSGKSISHVNQGEGSCYSKTDVAGYYNDLTEKILKDDPNILVPKYYVDTGEEIYFSIGIFQQGLAAYDLFLKTNEEIYKDKLIACANWALDNQQEDGSWVTFKFWEPKAPYSSMAQGEGISMLIRAAIVTGDKRFADAASMAKEFMLTPISDGGTTEYVGNDVILYEHTDVPVILNGWIFSLWGLYDYYKYFKDEDVYGVLCKTLESLKRKLPVFDTGFWSKYDAGKRVCSPFYHKLHIAQLTTMYDLFGDEIYIEYAKKWNGYQKSFWRSKVAFVIKAWQKIFER